MKPEKATEEHSDTGRNPDVRKLIDRGPVEMIPCVSCERPTKSHVVAYSVYDDEWFPISRSGIKDRHGDTIVIGAMCHDCFADADYPEELSPEVAKEYTFSVKV